MKILHVQETLAPRYGGPAAVLPRLAMAQASVGHEVVVATTNGDHPRGVYREPGWSTLEDGAARVFYAPVQFESMRVSLQLAGYLRSAIPGFDIVHVHGLYRFPGTVAASLCRYHKKPYVIRPYGSLDPYLYGKSTAGNVRAKRLYERLFDLPNLNAAAAIHYTAEAERERASFLRLQSPSFVIPNGLDWGHYRHLPRRGKMRERWGISESDTIVLFLGRIHPKKGLDLLIPAFDMVAKNRPGVQLVIAGPENDDYGRQVRRWVVDRGLETSVRFVGTLYESDVLQAYVDADIFALPSYTENFGMTVVEAMACALPVVISDQVNIHSEISRAGAGRVVPCNVEELATGLLNLLRADGPARQSVGLAGRKLVQDLYLWPVIVGALTEQYEAALKNAHPP